MKRDTSMRRGDGWEESPGEMGGGGKVCGGERVREGTVLARQTGIGAVTWGSLLSVVGLVSLLTAERQLEEVLKDSGG